MLLIDVNGKKTIYKNANCIGFIDKNKLTCYLFIFINIFLNPY